MRHFPSMYFLMGLLLLTALPRVARAQPTDEDQVDSMRKALGRTKPDTNRVNLLLTLGNVYTAGEAERPRDLDTALLLSRQAHALSRSLNYPRGQGMSYLLTAQAYRKKKETQKGKEYAQRAIDWLTKYGSLRDQAAAYTERANYWVVSETGINQSIGINGKIVSLLRRIGDTLKLAEELVHRGDLHQLQGKNVASLGMLKEALGLYQAIGHKQLQLVYDRLGFVSAKMGDYESAVGYGLLAVKTAEAFGDSIKLGEIYNRLGTTYKELNEPQKALFYFNQSLRVARTQYLTSTIILVSSTVTDMVEIYTSTPKTFTRREAADVQAALAHVQEVLDRRPQDQNDVDCQVAVASCRVGYHGRLQRQYEKALPYCTQLENLLNANLGDEYRVYIHSILIPFYVTSRQYQKAKVLLAQNEKLCQQQAYKQQLSTNHLWWFKLDSAQARFAPAITHYQHYKAISDSLIGERTKQRTTLLEVQYETQEKELRIVALRQESRLHASELQRAKTARNYIIAGAAMLLMLLGVIYNRYRLKQRSNRQLQAQQDELQAQQEELRTQHEELQAQQEVMQAQQVEIHKKNEHLSEVLVEKDVLLLQKDTLIREKEGLLTEKDNLLIAQERLLEEKEMLLKEIHHRVKNNLQVVMSLLNSQAASLKDHAALSAIRESQHRVQAMALIHQKLYQSEGVARIPMDAYIKEVVAYLQDSYQLSQAISFHLSVDSIELDITQAVPLGLIINEALTNAFKYAFPDQRAGKVALSLQRLGNTTCSLTIADDGVGLPEGYNPLQGRSMGMRLLQGFSSQLGGELSITSQEGLSIALVFEEERLGPVRTSAQYA